MRMLTWYKYQTLLSGKTERYGGEMISRGVPGGSTTHPCRPGSGPKDSPVAELLWLMRIRGLSVPDFSVKGSFNIVVHTLAE